MEIFHIPTKKHLEVHPITLDDCKKRLFHYGFGGKNPVELKGATDADAEKVKEWKDYIFIVAETNRYILAPEIFKP